jgi:parallel beta-helix repeat protein
VRKSTSTVVILLLFSVLGMQFVNSAEANFFPLQTPNPAIIIRSDGSIESSTNVTVPIEQDGNIFSLTDDIFGYTIAVECDRIILDGAGHFLMGNGSSTGLFLQQRSYLTVRNMGICNFRIGIQFYDIPHADSGHNTIVGNTIINNTIGILTSLYTGKNTITGNNIKDNKCGIKFDYCLGDSVIYQNNFINNTNHVVIDNSIDAWDKSEEGNYWDNYNGTDFDGDSIGQDPYILDENNQDNYPHIEPLEIPELKIPDTIEPLEIPEPEITEIIPENNLTLFGFLVVGIILLTIKLVYIRKEKNEKQ